MPNPERERLADPAWKTWGPYLAERAWGTVREDYSEHGTAWEFFPHDHARSRVYRWNEDGLAGLCDDQQALCLAFAFWNGRDPILKERFFGLTGNEGNHGEDVKEHYWFLDSTPTHSWMRWRYHYPQAEFPYADLVAENGRRGKLDPEYELLDTGAFDGGYWQIEIDVAKAAPDDVCIALRARNTGVDTATLHVLPTLWFRNTWEWGPGRHVPSLHGEDGRLVAEHYRLGRLELAGSGEPGLLFCENETNTQRLWGVPGTRYPKDAINDHVVHGAATVNPNGIGTKAALHYTLDVAAGETAEVRLRLAPGPRDLGAAHEETRRTRLAEADAFYDELAPKGATAEQRMVMRQAFGGLLWSKQFYHYDVEEWLDGDPGQVPPPEGRKQGRNHEWRHLNNFDVLSMPDTWEYPWYAAWDLGFHCVALAHVDPTFAKEQLILLCREWYMHPNGQMPAYEWAFGDVNPPVHALAALRVFEIDGRRDFPFLERILHKLMLNFTWWVNRKDAEGNNVFEGGFLGLDNIGPFDRSAILPSGARLEQSDGTAWMAVYCLALLEIALRLAEQDPTYEDVATKFFEHFALIAAAMNQKEGLWDEDEGFYFDVLRLPGGASVPVKVHSVVGLIPLFAVTTLGAATVERLPDFADRMRWFLEHKPAYADVAHVRMLKGSEGRLLSIVDEDRLRRLLRRMLDESEFLSPHGLRALSAYHREHPYELDVGGFSPSIDYEPAESTTGLFGGNSNWRGPVWFPVNYLMIEALRRYHRYLGDEFTVELPTGSGQRATLADVANELSRRLVSLFVDDEHGRRPIFGGTERLQTDPEWHDLLPFNEYFHGDNGAGLGASHQTGWTGLVADLIVDAGWIEH
jgi:hypothetical protein